MLENGKIIIDDPRVAALERQIVVLTTWLSDLTLACRVVGVHLPHPEPEKQGIDRFRSPPLEMFDGAAFVNTIPVIQPVPQTTYTEPSIELPRVERAD